MKYTMRGERTHHEIGREGYTMRGSPRAWMCYSKTQYILYDMSGAKPSYEGAMGRTV